MALKSISSSNRFGVLRLPYIITHAITRQNYTEHNHDSIYSTGLLDHFESCPPGMYTIENSKVTTGYASVNVEIMGSITKLNRTFGGTKMAVHVKSVNDFGETVIHKLRGLPEGPSKQVIEKFQPDNLVLIQGNIVQKRIEKQEGDQKISFYTSPISIFSASIISKSSVNINNSFSYAMITGVVTSKYSYISQPGSKYVGQMDILTWRDTMKKVANVQTNRIMISKEALKCFPFLPEIEKGEKLFVNGPLDYIEQPNLTGLLLVITAKQVMKMKSIGKFEERESSTDNNILD